MGIAADVVIRQWIMPEQSAVVAAEPVAPVVARASLLREARRRFEFARVGTQPEIAAADVDILAVSDSMDGASDQPVCAVNPVVESEAQTVDARLIILRCETSEQFFHRVGLAITICVFGINDVRRGADEHALVPRGDAGGEGEVIEEHRGLVVFAVAVHIFQNFHASALPVAADVRRRR